MTYSQVFSLNIWAKGVCRKRPVCGSDNFKVCNKEEH